MLLKILFDRQGTPSSTFSKLDAPVWTKWKYPQGTEAASWTHPSAFPWDEDKALRTTGRKTFIAAPNL